MSKKIEIKKGVVETELKEIVDLKREDSEVILSFTLGYTEFISLVCCG